MSIHQLHFGKKFYQDKKTGYWISTTSPRTRAHVWVWNHYHGIVPKGYHVHHKDHNKSNNQYENLTILTFAAHMNHHLDDNPNRREKLIHMANENRPLTKAWHASAEGRAWHKLHAIKCNFGNGELIKYNCQVCAKEYFCKHKAKSRTKFCSNACKSVARRRSGVDNVELNCAKCDKIFQKNKYSKQRFCSRSCAKKIID